MANHWAITIGINQYRHLQPLMHAQSDALFTHRFLTEDADIPSDHCVLLSDLTTSVGHQVVYPDKPAIAQWIQTITQQVSADDVLWFFFSGYGSQINGADYLMAIDGDPGQIESTGMAVTDLFEILSQLPTNKVLVVLDINRSQGALAGQAIGNQAIELAESHQVATLLSCQPEQYSHETLGVRHGLFTAALLESLQQNCTTPSQIFNYLTKRLPELCDHHWRPIQNPVGIIPEAVKTAVIVPTVSSTIASRGIAAAELTDPEGAATEDTAAAVSRYEESYEPSSDRATESSSGSTGLQTAIAGSVGAGATGAAIAANKTSSSTAVTATAATTLEPPIESAPYQKGLKGPEETGTYRSDAGRNQNNGDSQSSSAIVPYQEEGRPINGAKLRNWGLFVLALLMGLVLLKQPFVKTAWKGLGNKLGATQATDPNAETPEAGDTSDATLGTDGPVAATAPTAETPESETPESETSGSEAPEADTPETTTPASEPATAETQEAATQPDAQPEDTEPENTEPEESTETPAEQPEAPAAQANSTANPEADKATAAALIAKANAALEQRQYSEALITLQQVPNSQRDSSFSTVLTKARAGAAEVQQANASVLTEARTSIQPTQASQFTQAIAKARLIKRGEPSYTEAQEDIRSWSRIILDIAEGRATSGNLNGAIAAANVMPNANSEFHKKAQDRIVFWQQRQRSRNIISDAQKIPKSGQASTYQKGIVKLREVPIEHPEYETAQRLADDWSQRIFSIAQARAAQGRESAAIQAAILVPSGTTAYEPTQQAIRRWRAGN